MDERSFCPLVAVGTVLRPGWIEVMVPGPQHPYIRRDGSIVARQEELVWAVLARCTGYSTVRQVVAAVGKEFPEVEPRLISAVVGQLTRMGALVDSRATYREFHPRTGNPRHFEHVMSEEEARRYARRGRLPVATAATDYALTQEVTPLARLLAERASCRNFSSVPLRLQALGHVLVSGYSLVTHATPSAGGLYPLKLYVINAHGTSNLAPGYYEYDPGSRRHRHRLVPLSGRLDEPLVQYMFNCQGHTLPFGAPAAVVIAADMQLHPGQYSDRGYRYTHIEAGLVLDNILLAGTELGIATLPYGDYLDEELAAELRMDGGLEPGRVWPLVTVMLGYPGGPPGPDTESRVRELQAALVGRNKPVSGVWVTFGRRPGQKATFVGATARVREPDNRRKTFATTGKATSVALAKLKALAEAYERSVSADVRVDAEATARELADAGKTWLDPRVVAPLTAAQYASLPPLGPFSEDQIFQWVAGRHVADGHTVLVPVDLVFFPLDTTRWGRKRLVNASSSGVAAFTSEGGATERALLELIERDALMRHWFTHVAPRRIPPSMLPYHWARRAAYWQEHGRRVEVLDCSRHGVVIVAVVIHSDAHPCIATGAAASLESFEQAVAKAFMEAEIYVDVYSRRPWKKRIRPGAVRAVRDHGRLYAFGDYSAELEWLWSGPEGSIPEPAATAEQLYAELDVVAVSLSGPDAPLTVVRVVSPELVPVNFGHRTTHHTHHSLAGQVDERSLALPHFVA